MKRKIGDVYYRINKRLSNSRNKIKMIDSDGVEWFRYDKERIEYSISKFTITAILVKTLQGDEDINDYYHSFDLQTEYFLRDEDKELEQWYEEDFANEVFQSETNAMIRVETLKKEQILYGN